MKSATKKVLLPPEIETSVMAYCETHGLSFSLFARLAILRQLRCQPRLEPAAELPCGNPDPAAAGRAGAAARWGKRD